MSKKIKAIWPLAPDAPLVITEVIRRKGHALTQKMVETRGEPLGYVTISSHKGPPTVRPIYRTETWVQHPSDKTKTRYIYGGYAIGVENYSGLNYMVDSEGCALADIAAKIEKRSTAELTATQGGGHAKPRSQVVN